MLSTRISCVSTSLLFVTAAAFAQSPVTFEVASVKKTEPLSVNSIMGGKMNLGMVIDNAQVSIKSMSIAEMMRFAYKVKPYQITGPEWLTAERYTVTAKMPAGSTRDQIPEMMAALLAERFKIAFHRESKEQGVYALIVMKGGAKLTESAPDEIAPTPTGTPAGPQASAPTDGSAQVRVNVSSDVNGTIQQASPYGNVKFVPRQDGMRLECTKMTATGMVDQLGRFLERPVIDMTDLKGKYDLTLDVGWGDMMAMARGVGMAFPMQAPPGAMEPGNSAVFTAVQAYGLKLDPRKAAIDMLVIDHVEKIPTEN